MTNARYIMPMNRPASWWASPYREGIPLGNGATGALVYGGAAFERVLLTHAACWRGGVSPELPDVSAFLPEMREKIINGHMPEGDRMLEDALCRAGYHPRCAAIVPMADLRAVTPAHHGFRHYRRTLDMENACAEVSYQDGARQYRAAISFPAPAMCWRWKSRPTPRWRMFPCCWKRIRPRAPVRNPSCQKSSSSVPMANTSFLPLSWMDGHSVRSAA